MRTNKLIVFGLEKQAVELKAKGLSDALIAKALTKESGENVNAMNVTRYFIREQEAFKKVVSRSVVLQTKTAEGRLNAVNQLCYINAETLKILKDAKKAQEFKTALKAIERVEKQLELQAKLLGEITEQPTQVMINVMQVAQQERR